MTDDFLEMHPKKFFRNSTWSA